MTITIRPLEPEGWPAFREIRLAALKENPRAYSGSYEDSLKRPDEAWRALVRGATHQVFGLFEGTGLIGITAVFASDEDPSGQTAALMMSYILPGFRRRGLSRMLYEARLAWIRERPQFKRVTVSVRESNLPSRQANQRFGFVQKGAQSRVWRDGDTEDEVFYELRLD
jgi:RimJ/RimL family protein N-acetyltransferase